MPDFTRERGSAGLKFMLCAVAIALGARVGWSQPVPDTILLPDSLGPIRPPNHLAFGSSTDNMYVASESSDIIVVDGSFTGNFQRIKRIYTGTPVGAVLLVSQHNRLYCIYPSQGRIGVIDCATNDTVGSIQVSSRPGVLCYSSGSDKLYCGDSANRKVWVIDCAADTVRKVIPVGRGLNAMVEDPTTGKMYVATQDAVLAISSSADSVVATISAVKKALCLCVNKRRQKLYVVPASVGGPDTVFVVSTLTDSVVAKPSYGNIEPMLACNEITDRLYGANDVGDILEFDCIQDTLIRGVYVGDSDGKLGLVCDSVRNRLFYLYQDYNRGYLLELDCATFDVISNTYVGVYPDILQVDPPRYRLMCLAWSSAASAMPVFDYKSDTAYTVGAVPLCGWTYTMRHNPATSRLYCWWGLGTGGMGVVDEQSNRVVAQAFLAQVNMSQSAYSRTSNKYYLHAVKKGHVGIGVIDGTIDRLVRLIEMGSSGPFPCWCPDGNKLYCFARDGLRRYVAVVDCYTDSVVRKIDFYHIGYGIEYLGEGRMLCIRQGGFTLIDASADSVLVDSAFTEPVYAVAHTGDGEKVYVVRNGRLEVRSSSSLSLLATINWPYYDSGYRGTTLAYSDTTHKLYWFVGFGSGEDSVLSIDATSDIVVARMDTAGPNHADCVGFDHTGRYLFCLSGALRVYDTQSDSLIGTYRDLPWGPYSLASSPEQRCMYVGCQDVILVYPDAPPGVEETPNAEVRARDSGPTVVRGMINLQPAIYNLQSEIALLSVDGRKVLDLRPGANDVRALAPGVYFIRGPKTDDGRTDAAVRKVVLTE